MKLDIRGRHVVIPELIHAGYIRDVAPVFFAIMRIYVTTYMSLHLLTTLYILAP